MRRRSIPFTALFFAVGLLGAHGCQSLSEAQSARADEPSEGGGAVAERRSAQTFDQYAWLNELDSEAASYVALKDRFAEPDGFRRSSPEVGSYSEWLQGLPMHPSRTQVYAFNGEPLDRPSAAVVAMDVGRRDLMQCADTIIRLHAEFLWSTGRQDEAAYRFTSGTLSRWSDYQAGERFKISGSRVERRSGEPRSASYRSYRTWLDLIFTYAGTASLHRDAPAREPGSQLEIGDFFVDPGFPGHAVVILDLVEDSRGRRLALLGQGFMPAEEVHVLKSDDAVDGVWFALPEGSSALLRTPSWRAFRREQARYFPADLEQR